MHLRALQINFKNFICDRSPVNFDALPLVGLDIHKANYFAKLTTALENKFINTSKYLQNKFTKLAFKYILDYPSMSSNLDEYGELFPVFLKETGLCFASHIAIIDTMIFNTVANYIETEIADDLISTEQSLSLSATIHKNYKKSDICLSLNKAINLAEVLVASYKQWQVMAEDSAQEGTGYNYDDTDIIQLISYPKQFKAALKSITICEYQWLSAIKNGKTIACATDTALMYDAKFDLSPMLDFCFKNKLIDKVFRAA